MADSSSFGHRKSSSSCSSLSLPSPMTNGKSLPRSSSSVSSTYNNGARSTTTPSRSYSDSMYFDSNENEGLADELVNGEVIDDAPPKAGDGIAVTVRFRPLSEREVQRGDEISWYPDDDNTVRCEYNPAAAYGFDRVFGPSTTSQMVYDVAARPVIKAAMEGINGTVFAYGVTSSGKTHTMHGDHNSPGIIPLAIRDVFSIIQDTPGREFLLRVSYLEIYNEVINDLLDPMGQNLRVREDGQGTYVEGIKDEVVVSPGHALSFIAAGEEHRHVGSNNFNLFSSRSHTIFTMMIESSGHGDDYDGVIFSQLNLIDLAGSESSKTETTGLRRKEGAYINKSLLTLGTVIGKLSEGKASHVPYRDSKLTRLLQSSLSGHGHVSLICTVTPASSNMEETHNTLKFASRAKRVEICASRNKIIDEKSLIKKYQTEISSLKQELDQLKKGMLPGISHEEILSLRQKLEEGQVKMQSRLEEEEEAKAALMSRIQKLTKLILVSTKSPLGGTISDLPSHQRLRSHGEVDSVPIFLFFLHFNCVVSIWKSYFDADSFISGKKLDVQREGSPLLGESEDQKDSPTSAPSVPSENSFDPNYKRSSSKWMEEESPASCSESTQVGDIFSETPMAGMTMSDQMDLLVEQVKMLAGEIAFSTSTLKRLLKQSENDPNGSQTQVQNLECEIEEKRRQMKALEQRIIESETSVSNTSLVDMQKTVSRLVTQCNEKAFELECLENKDLHEKVQRMQDQLASVTGYKIPSCFDQCVSEIEELKQKVQLQDIKNEKLRLENVHLIEEKKGLLVQSQRLAEEAIYAKELASAAAAELKNLAGEVTKLSLQNSRQAKDVLAAQEMGFLRGSGMQNGRKYPDSKGDGLKLARKDDAKMELQVRKQREEALEAALFEKGLAEEDYKKKFDEAKKREAALENDLANMWVLVAKMKKGGGVVPELCVDHERSSDEIDVSDLKTNEYENENCLKKVQVSDSIITANGDSEVEPLVVRLKARMQAMKQKHHEPLGNGDANSHVCKVCFEAPTSALLLPCRHFSLCKPCSLACSECPLCRSKIANRIFTFPS
ncbi:hypothetical protein GIB67_019472 [Kingdonia uniflora]|uniref:Kinesin-like protein KIN-7D, mitochondrial n=1 Tax=Kingdonia uniflora TaxID=39325 RepID=A0A7J7N0K8_9MAGN|nr:hypothetical protein GIB67_019472 [Kingdonia uniflora]